MIFHSSPNTVTHLNDIEIIWIPTVSCFQILSYAKPKRPDASGALAPGPVSLQHRAVTVKNAVRRIN